MQNLSCTNLILHKHCKICENYIPQKFPCTHSVFIVNMLIWQIEGTFKINVPPMILGYDTQSRYSDGSTPSVYLLLSLEPTLNEFPLLMKKVQLQ